MLRFMTSAGSLADQPLACLTVVYKIIPNQGSCKSIQFSTATSYHHLPKPLLSKLGCTMEYSGGGVGEVSVTDARDHPLPPGDPGFHWSGTVLGIWIAKSDVTEVKNI